MLQYLFINLLTFLHGSQISLDSYLLPILLSTQARMQDRIHRNLDVLDLATSSMPVNKYQSLYQAVEYCLLHEGDPLVQCEIVDDLWELVNHKAKIYLNVPSQLVAEYIQQRGGLDERLIRRMAREEPLNETFQVRARAVTER